MLHICWFHIDWFSSGHRAMSWSWPALPYLSDSWFSSSLMRRMDLTDFFLLQDHPHRCVDIFILNSNTLPHFEHLNRASCLTHKSHTVICVWFCSIRAKYPCGSFFLSAVCHTVKSFPLFRQQVRLLSLSSLLQLFLCSSVPFLVILFVNDLFVNAL